MWLVGKIEGGCCDEVYTDVGILLVKLFSTTGGVLVDGGGVEVVDGCCGVSGGTRKIKEKGITIKKLGNKKHFFKILQN